MSERHVIVDASNVALCEAWQCSLEPGTDRDLAKRRLLDAGASWAAAMGVRATFVFDGVGTHGVGERELGSRVSVVATGSGTADAWIEAEVARLAGEGAGGSVWVVTNDATVRSATRAGVELHVGADDFAREVLAVGASGGVGPDEGDLPEPPPLPRGLAADLDEDVLNKLDRMRRGE